MSYIYELYDHTAFCSKKIVLKAFICKRTELSFFDRWGFTPLEEAERFEHPEVAKLLISFMQKKEHPETD